MGGAVSPRDEAMVMRRLTSFGQLLRFLGTLTGQDRAFFTYNCANQHLGRSL